MDPEHLLTGELEEEFAVRYINDRGPGGIKRLRECLSNEDSGSVPPPVALPSLRVSSELRACNDLMKTLKSLIAEFSKNGDDSAAAIVKSYSYNNFFKRKRKYPDSTSSNSGVV